MVFLDDFYTPPAHYHPRLLRRINMIKDFEFISGLQKKKFINLKLLLPGFDDPEIFFDFIELFYVESLEIDLSEATKWCCRRYQMALRDLLAFQPNVKHLKITGSQRYPYNDIFTHKIALESDHPLVHYQLKTFHYSVSEYVDECSELDSSSDCGSFSLTKYARIRRNFMDFIVFNGLQIEDLRLEHPAIRTKELIFMLQNLKQLKILRLSISRLFNDQIDFNSHDVCTMEPLVHLNKLQLINNAIMNPTKSEFVKLLLSKSPNLKEIRLKFGYFGELVPIWLTQYNTKLTTIDDGVDMVSNEMFKMRKFQSIQTLKISKGFYASFSQFYRALSIITHFSRLNPNLDKLVIKIREIGGSSDVYERKFENFIGGLAEMSMLTELEISFSPKFKFLQKVFMKVVASSMEHPSEWACLDKVTLQTIGERPVEFWTIHEEDESDSRSSEEISFDSFSEAE